MSTHAKLAIPVLLVFVGYVIFLLIGNDEIGAFSSVRASGEINQSANFLVVTEKGFQRDQNNQIVSFYVKDRLGNEAVVNLKEPAPEAVATAKVVELLGHMHGNEFIGIRAKPVENAEY